MAYTIPTVSTAFPACLFLVSLLGCADSGPSAATNEAIQRLSTELAGAGVEVCSESFKPLGRDGQYIVSVLIDANVGQIPYRKIAELPLPLMVSLTRRTVDRQTVRELANTPGIVLLCISRSVISQNAFCELEQFRQLKALIIDDCEVQGMENAPALSLPPTLWLLELKNLDTASQFFNACTSGSLARIRSLDLSQSPLPPGNPVQLGRAVNLEDLFLNETPVNDETMASVGRLVNLRNLQLNETRVTDAGLRELTRLKDLRMLHLGNTKITTEALLTVLGSFHELHVLDVTNTEVDVERIKPVCRRTSVFP